MVARIRSILNSVGWRLSTACSQYCTAATAQSIGSLRRKIEHASLDFAPYCLGKMFVDSEYIRAGTIFFAAAQNRIPESNDRLIEIIIAPVVRLSLSPQLHFRRPPKIGPLSRTI